MPTVTGYERIFTRPFDIAVYGEFINHAFLHGERSAVPRRHHVKLACGEMLIYDFGSYQDESKKRIALVAVSPINNRSCLLTRGTERAALDSYMRTHRYDAAIAAFYAPGENKWRFSLARFALAYDRAACVMRDSFLAGEGEPSYTINRQLLSVLEDSKPYPLLSRLEKAFSRDSFLKDYMQSGGTRSCDFNFTLYEEQPFDKEAAVTPGMLGTVFENQMDSVLRKKRGAFYTSCEIVQYMCRESLIHYLSSQTELNRNQIRAFICCDYPSMDIAPVQIQQKTAELEHALKRIKVLDPAAGSGAYVIGMLDEIVKARLHTYYFSVQKGSGIGCQTDEVFYKFTEDALRAIRGVDIEEEALQIVQLRIRSFCRSLLNDGEVKNFPEFAGQLKCGDGLLDEVEERFDVVIGNPPYGIVYEPAVKQTYEALYPTFKRNYDLYTAFYERGIHLLKDKGMLHYITPNTFLNGDYFKAVRRFITSSCRVVQVTDFKEHPVFPDPTVFVSILLAQKDESIAGERPYLYRNFTFMGKEKGYVYSRETAVCSSDRPLRPVSSIMESIANKPSVVPLESLFYVKDVGFNYWTKGKGKQRKGSIGSRVFYQGDRLDERDIPYLKGRNISRYAITNPGHYLRHNYQTLLDKEIDILRYSEEFLTASPKIVYRQTSDRIVAALDRGRNYVDKTVHIILPKETPLSLDLRYLLALLNSRLFIYLYRELSQERYGRAFTQVKTVYVKQLPVKIIGPDEQRAWIDIVEQLQILAERAAAGNKEAAQHAAGLQEKIDEMVYRLYGLSAEETEKELKGEEP